MADLAHYQNAVQTLIQRIAALKPHKDNLEWQVWADTTHGHYQLLNVGWRGDQRVHRCVIHLDIKDGKVWIQHNSTEIELDEELIVLGVAREDILLGFLPAYRRTEAQLAA
ncbi:MAG: XisI protein [Planctomycetes bacterium]|nr:XisI protein [Planctomycetota bacterium]